MQREHNASKSKEIAEAIEAWFDAKGFSNDKVEFTRTTPTWDGHDDYFVEEEVLLLPRKARALSADIFITDGSAIGLGFRITSEWHKVFFWGFEPIILDVDVILGLLEFAASGSFGVSSISVFRKFQLGKRLSAPKGVCESVTGLTPGRRLPKVYAEEAESGYRRIERLREWN